MWDVEWEQFRNVRKHVWKHQDEENYAKPLENRFPARDLKPGPNEYEETPTTRPPLLVCRIVAELKLISNHTSML
jgi:hypothetical protein